MEQTINTQCEATLHHGPGHQSRTNCELTGKHNIHQCHYLYPGIGNVLAKWKGKKKFTGYFDEPPSSERFEMGNKHSGNRTHKKRAKGAGRKSLPVNKRMVKISVFVPLASIKRIDEIAKSLHCKRSQAIRMLLEQ